MKKLAMGHRKLYINNKDSGGELKWYIGTVHEINTQSARSSMHKKKHTEPFCYNKSTLKVGYL